MKLKFMTFILTCSFCSVTWARVDIKTTKVLVLPEAPHYEMISKETQNRLLPKNLKDQENSNKILSQLADNTVSIWWEKTPLRDSQVGRAAEVAEKKLNVQAEIEDSNKVRHTMAFKILAMQALAKLEYKGWVRAAISYDAKAAKTEAEITEKINDKQDFLISHSMTQTENKSQLGFRWSW